MGYTQGSLAKLKQKKDLSPSIHSLIIIINYIYIYLNTYNK